MTELYIVRHGETATNFENKVNGSGTDLSLNEAGRNQAKKLSQQININNFDEIYSSPLKRAYQTAEILNQNTHTIRVDPRLTEINYGFWDGLTVNETISAHPDGYDENKLISINYIKYSPDGESFEKVFKRVQSFIKDMSEKKNEKILVVCHGFITRSFVKVVTHIPNISDLMEPNNASVVKIHISQTGHPYLNYYSRLTDI